MSLYKKWLQAAYDKTGKSIRKFWDGYMPREQKIYERMLADKNPKIHATVAELAAEYDMPAEWVVGFVDGIKDAFEGGSGLDMNEVGEDALIDATVDFERLYMKMVQFKAEHLRGLPQWDAVFTAEERGELARRQKEGGTLRRETPKVGRNDPCPCGSGRKYKKCCGA